MCQFCERRKDIDFGWNQPALPYHGNLPGANLSGNVLNNEEWDGRIYDYKSKTPELMLTCPNYFDGMGVGTIVIPIKFCPECGRELGKNNDTRGC